MPSDVGTRVVEYVRRRLQVDAEWCAEHDRGFTWWAGPLAQHIWADPCIEDDGCLLSRVHIRTDLVTGVPNDKRIGVLAPLMARATMSGLVRTGEEAENLQLASSAYVHDVVEESYSRAIAMAAALQAAEAHLQASALAEALEAEPAVSGPPGRSVRPVLDEILGIIGGAIAPAGAGPSVYAGREMVEASKMLDNAGFLSFAGEDGLTAEFPFGPRTSFLKLTTTDRHPVIGSGLLTRLTLPLVGSATVASAPAGVRRSLKLNAQELTDATWITFFGSWCSRGPLELTFTSFLPNMLSNGSPGWVTNAVQAMAGRARWAAEVFGREDGAKPSAAADGGA